MHKRQAVIFEALSEAITRQGARQVQALDLYALAADIERALTGSPAAPGHSPLDPEGDGLTPPELNSANDV